MTTGTNPIIKTVNIAYLSTRAAIFLIDTLFIPLAWLGAYWLRFNMSMIPEDYWDEALLALPFVMVVHVAVYLGFGLYRGDWRYSSLADLLRIIKAVVITCASILIVLWMETRMDGIPRSVIPLYGLLLVGFLGGVRFGFRSFKERTNLPKTGKRVLIIGAGQAGESVARDLLRSHDNQYHPVVFVDDNPAKVGCDIHGLRVVGNCQQIPQIVTEYKIDLAIIAIPSANSAKMRRIVNFCEMTTIAFRTLPSLSDLAAGRININALRDVSIEDLLGRDPVTLDWHRIAEGVTDKIVLITGGGGSIGAEICRQVAKLLPKKLLILDNGEFNLYGIQRELTADYPHLALSCFLVDITDEKAIQQIMQQHKPSVVFHAAAYKHIPLLEGQIRAAVKNNVVGTYVVAQAASEADVAQFILISTDKVVNPANVLGATKRVAEILCQNLNRYSSTQFMTVRFGNVLGSTGSVLPLFQQQLARGGPLTVTHPEVTRYFMTIPEAVQLILQATIMGKGGEVFVLDMGEPVKIRYLAEQMIRLSGRMVGEDIQIVYTGLRLGDKLHESLFHDHETLVETSHQKILQALPTELNWDELMAVFTQLKEACAALDDDNMRHLLRQIIPEYGTTTPMTIPFALGSHFFKPEMEPTDVTN